MREELTGALLLLVVLVSTISGEQYDPRAGIDGRSLYSKNRNSLYNVRRLIGLQHPAYQQSPRNAQAKHLDVALPMSILNSDGSLLLHLKDSELWEKENAGRGQNLEAALMPTYLKALERSEPHDDGIAPEEPENQVPNPKVLLSKLLEHFDHESGLNDWEEESLAEVVDEIKTRDKQGFTFNLRDAINKFFEKHVPPLSDDEETNHRRRAMQPPGVFFINLKDLEEHFENMYESMHGDEGLSDFVQKDDQGGVYFNIADIIKEEQVLEKEEAEAKELSKNSTDGSREMDPNGKLAEGLSRSNMPVKIGKDEGLFFSLNNTQN